MFNIHTINKSDCDVFAAMETITAKDVQAVIKKFSSGIVKTPKVGKLAICNRFIPEIKASASELLSQEGSCVFYAVDKFPKGLFSKKHIRIFIWAPLTDKLYVVPVQAVSFEKPAQKATEEFFIKETGSEHPHHKETFGGKEHKCFYEKIELYRKFSITEEEINAVQDILHHHFRWADPDPWVQEHFYVEDCQEPMFYLRNEIEEIPYYSVRVSYPSRHFLGGEIDE